MAVRGETFAPQTLQTLGSAGATSSGGSSSYTSSYQPGTYQPSEASAGITDLLDKIIARYSEGGGFSKAALDKLGTRKGKDVAAKEVNLMGRGLGTTTRGANVGKAWEEDIGGPARLGIEEQRLAALMQALQAKAGYMERAEGRALTFAEQEAQRQQFYAEMAQRERLAQQAARGGGGTTVGTTVAGTSGGGGGGAPPRRPGSERLPIAGPEGHFGTPDPDNPFGGGSGEPFRLLPGVFQAGGGPLLAPGAPPT